MRSPIVDAIADQLHRFLPRSRYSSSWSGQSWSEVFNTPLPPYLSFLPVLFRIISYLAIAPVILLVVLDFAGYIVWRIYDQPFWSGTRTAFYKFTASPVFAKSRTGSPNLSKDQGDSTKLHPVSASSAAVRHSHAPAAAVSPSSGKEASISPISSSASLHEFMTSGGVTDETETSPSSPVVGMSNAQLPTVESGNEKRSNSLGLGFPQDTGSEEERSTPTMFVASPSPASISAAMALEDSPTTTLSSSSSSVANLEEDDRAFQEAKAVVNPVTAQQQH